MKKETIDALSREFGADQIKSRVGPGGKELAYVEAHAVIARLNEALQSDWSFEVVEHRVVDDEAVVVGRLTVFGPPVVIKTAFGSQQIKRYEQSGQVISLGDDLKAAASDALKKSATMLGVGLHLYDRDRDNGAKSNGQQPGNGGNGNNGHSANGNGQGRITNAQINKLRELVGELRRDWENFRADIRELHGVNLEYLSKGTASDVIASLIAEARRAKGSGTRSSQ